MDELMRSESDQLNVAIDGNSGTGKSSLANLLENVYDCNLFHMDDFFLTPDLRTEERLNEAGGNVDYLRFYNEVIKGLESGKEFSYRKFDCQLLEFIPADPVRPKKLNIVEGSYSMHPQLIDHYDLKIFLELNEDEQKQRILARNGLMMHERFINEWIPMEEKYFKELGIKEKCDLIISI
ncbi:MAG: uridine kinase [Clostridiales bacterium]|nr:uridine kinase [Clostridiales bacterium]